MYNNDLYLTGFYSNYRCFKCVCGGGGVVFVWQEYKRKQQIMLIFEPFVAAHARGDRVSNITVHEETYPLFMHTHPFEETAGGTKANLAVYPINA